MTEPRDPEQTPDVPNDPVPEPAGPEPEDDASVANEAPEDDGA